MVSPIGNLNNPRHYCIPNTRLPKVPLIPPIPPLSVEVETWLQSRDDRCRQWEEQMKNDSYHRRGCNIHRGSVRLVLTEFSPYGTRLSLFLSITDTPFSGE
jgi:hypothetical protein